MAKPRIFISSTFYDLRQVRADIDYFIDSMGYEAVRNEEGDIPYGQQEALEQYCYKEIDKADIIVSIIGGRFGSESRSGKGSVTQLEIKTAIERNKQVYIFIEKNVNTEYNTYLKNKDNTNTIYSYVDDPRIYKFIEEIKALKRNNIIKEFETAQDIVSYLKNQLSGLFQRFLEGQARAKERDLIKELENTAANLNKLVQFLSDQNKDQADSVNRILMINHPIINFISKILSIKYNFYIDGIEDLRSLLTAYAFNPLAVIDSDEYYRWNRSNSYNLLEEEIGLSKNLFDDKGKLIYISSSNWKDNYVQYKTSPLFQTPSSDNDLPF